MVTPGQWDDEDVGEGSQGDVKDAWDAESEDEVVVSPAAAIAKPSTTTKKLSIEAKIAERNKLKAAATEHEEDRDETPDQRKARLARQVVDADFQNMKDLFDGVNVHPREKGSASASPTVDLATTSLTSLKTKAELDTACTLLGSTLVNLCSSHHYYALVDHVLRAAVAPLNVEETRKLSSVLTMLVNDKTRAQKEAAGGGKKKKATTKAKAMLAGTGTAKSNGLDMTNYDEVAAYDDFDGFM
jgi:translation initiation factor 3 subunit J